MPDPPTAVNQGDLYFCEPDPVDTVGSEQEKDRPWVIISLSKLHRGNCVVAVPLSKQVGKAVAHLVKIPKEEFQMEVGTTPYDCVALTDQIRSLDKTRFRRKAGRMTQRGLNVVLLGLKRLTGMP